MVGKALIRTATSPLPLNPRLSIRLHKIPELPNKTIEAQEHSPQQPRQTHPWPMKVLAQVIAAQQTGNYWRREFESDNRYAQIGRRRAPLIFTHRANNLFCRLSDAPFLLRSRHLEGFMRRRDGSFQISLRMR